MDWIELTIHTTTAGADIVSEALMAEGATGTMVENTLIPDAKILLSQAYAQLQSMDIVNDAQRYSAIQSAITNLEYVISLPAPTTAEVASAMGQLTQAMAGIY